ncbi:MAG TPA: hypothetical protein VHR72_11075 [Gemmataceae bacterium]|jgi:hypothetical protein|nr:hypothetical protein [Gemmataceae bacterium]
MTDAKQPRNHTPYQQKIIKRFYENQGDIKHARLSELVGEIYLSEGKKREKVWKDIEATMTKLGVSPARVEHLMSQRKPELIADLVKELDRAK